MNNVGATRRIDNLGRVVIPNEYRRALHIKPSELLEMFLDDDKIVITKHDIISKNDNFLKIYLDLLNRFYNVSIVILNSENIIYQTKDIGINNIEQVLNDAAWKKIQINPTGDLLGYIALSNYQSLNEKNIELITILINKLFEE